MEQYVSVDYYDEFQTPLISDEGGRVSVFIIFLVPFIITAISVTYVRGLNYVVVGLGVICSIAYLVASIRGTFVLPKEVMFFLALVVWSCFGIFVAKAPSLHYQGLFTFFQFLVMITIIAHYSNNVKMIRILLFSVVIGAAIVGTECVITGEYQRAEYGPDIERARAMAMNANVFAIMLVYTAMILFYFLDTWKSWIMKAAAIGMILFLSLFVIASGSRVGFVSFVLLLPTWFFISYRKEILKRPGAFILTLAVVIIVSGFLFSRVAGTRMQRRMVEMSEARETGGGGGSIQARTLMIKEAFAIITSHPLLGVGLNHFRFYSSTGMYSHNNYTEVFCNIGIPGGIFYYSVLIVLWLRLRWLSKLSLEDKVRKFVNMAKTFVIIQLVSDMAHVSHSIKFSWIVAAILIGFSYQLEQKIKGRMLTGYHESADEYQLQPECY